MAKLLMKSLKADLPALAELIRSQGRGRDTVLAHITPQEAALLKKRGGSGSMNPATGLPEFQEDYGIDYSQADTGGGFSGFNVPDVQAEQETMAQFQDYYPSGAEQITTFEPTYVSGYDIPSGGFYPGGEQPRVTGYDITPGADVAFRGEPPPAATPGIERARVEIEPTRSVMDRLGLTEKDLPRLGLGALLTGGLTAANLARTRQAQGQAQASREELAALGKPYQQVGAQLRGAAERGELTPVNQQIINAARAQLQQGIATRGGVGAAQAQNQIADLTQRLLQNQFDLGLRVSNIGDQYIQGAIRTGLQADQAINAANQNFYTQLASMAAPFILGQQPVYQVTTPVRRG